MKICSRTPSREKERGMDRLTLATMEFFGDGLPDLPSDENQASAPDALPQVDVAVPMCVTGGVR